MENEIAPEAPVAQRPPPTRDWAEAEWFQVWLRLARREYQGHAETVPTSELKQAA